MLPVFNEYFGNPSSIYSYGREAKRLVDKARDRVAKAECFARGNILYAGGSERTTGHYGVAYATRKEATI